MQNLLAKKTKSPRAKPQSQANILARNLPKSKKNDLMENRRKVFNAMFHFIRKAPINYICPKINKAECEDSEVAYIAKLSKAISDELKKNYEYLNSFDLSCITFRKRKVV